MVGNCQSDCLPRPNGDDEDNNGDASSDDNDDVWINHNDIGGANGDDEDETIKTMMCG